MDAASYIRLHRDCGFYLVLLDSLITLSRENTLEACG